MKTIGISSLTLIRSIARTATLLLALVASGVHAQTYYWQNFAGQPGVTGSADGTATTARFFNPRGMSMDSEGNLFVADGDNHTIRKVTSTGVVTTVAGSAGTAGSTDGTSSAARFNGPNSVAADALGNLFVADTFNHTIRKVTSLGMVSTLAGTAGLSGSINGTGPAARFSSPSGITVDPSGNLYVADLGNHVIRKISQTGVVTTLAGSAGFTGAADGTGIAARFNQPCGIVIDPSNTLFVTDLGNRTIRKITDSGVVTTLAGSAGIIGSSDGQGAAARFYNPNAIANGGAGTLYVADTFNHTIRRISSNGEVSTIGGSAGVSGSSPGLGGSARFNYPEGIVSDGFGTVFVVDTYNHRISKGVPAYALTDCISWWRAENNHQDSIGANHGTAVNGATFAAGEVGQAWSFDGTDDYVNVPTSSNLNLVSDQGWTMEGWIKPNAGSLSGFIAHKGSQLSGEAPYWGVYLSEGKLRFELCSSSGYYDTVRSSATIVGGQWHHIAVAVDSMGGPISAYHLYINGADAGVSFSHNGTSSGTVNVTEPLRIGVVKNLGGSLGAFFSGLIDELSIYNRALPPAEILAIYSRGSAGKLGNAAPNITTASPLPPGMAGNSYSLNLAASEGVLPYTWSLAAGSLPDDLIMSSNGAISGTPGLAGTASFTVRVTGNDGGTATKDFSLTIDPALPEGTGLTALAVSNVALTPGFHRSVTDYSATVPIDYVWIDVIPEDPWSNLEWSIGGGEYRSFDGWRGQVRLSAGTNLVQVRVTTTNQDVTIYNLSLTRTSGTVSDFFNPPVADSPDTGGGWVKTVAVQADGKTVVGGIFGSLCQQPRINLGRVIPNGSLDETFAPAAGSGEIGPNGERDFVSALAIQADGKILVGGVFTMLGGQAVTNLGRLNSDGTLDDTFTSAVAYPVEHLVVQPDGKILVGGWGRLNRLNEDGTLDPEFSIQNWAGFVRGLARQPDGKVLVLFEQDGVHRLNADGTADPEFIPFHVDPLGDGNHACMALQADGRILVSGLLPADEFLGIVRLESDGTRDASYFVDVDEGGMGALTLFPLPDGKTLVGGGFAMLGGQPRQNLGRLNSDGTTDLDFVVGVQGYSSNTHVSCFGAMPDGRIVVGGCFNELGGKERQNLGRLMADGQGPLITITTASQLPSGTVGVSYSATLAASGGTEPYYWRIIEGLIDEGLTLGTDGTITGIPTGFFGSGPFTVEVSDANGWSSAKEFLLITGELYFLYSGQIPWGISGKAFDLTLDLVGGTAPYSFSLVAGSLPDGLIMSGNGRITGTPGALGTSIFTLRAVDADGIWKEEQLSMSIYSATDLKEMWITNGLIPDFDPAITTYQAQVSTDHINLGATRADENSEMQVRINGGIFEVWEPNPFLGTDFAVNPGTNTFEIKVSTSGGGSRIYTITVTRPYAMIHVTHGSEVIMDGSATPLQFGQTSPAKAVSRNLTIRNSGSDTLNLGTIHHGGSHPSDFMVTAPAVTALAPGEDTTFTVTFQPLGGGERNATIHIDSNALGDANTFDIALIGTGLSYTHDTDGDGMNDGAEFDLADLGFNWNAGQPGLVSTYYGGANRAGLFTSAQIQALQVDTPLLAKDPATGWFTMTLRVEKSTDLVHFTPFPLSSSQTSIKSNGELEFRFSVPDNAAFFRIEAK